MAKFYDEKYDRMIEDEEELESLREIAKLANSIPKYSIPVSDFRDCIIGEDVSRLSEDLAGDSLVAVDNMMKAGYTEDDAIRYYIACMTYYSNKSIGEETVSDLEDYLSGK
jgi:acyl carrier protein